MMWPPSIDLLTRLMNRFLVRTLELVLLAAILSQHLKRNRRMTYAQPPVGGLSQHVGRISEAKSATSGAVGYAPSALTHPTNLPSRRLALRLASRFRLLHRRQQYIGRHAEARAQPLHHGHAQSLLA